MYTIIGFKRFKSKQTGKPYITLFFTRENVRDASLTGLEAGSQMVSDDVIVGDLYAGALANFVFEPDYTGRARLVSVVIQ